jgi:hypothetical protein
MQKLLQSTTYFICCAIVTSLLLPTFREDSLTVFEAIRFAFLPGVLFGVTTLFVLNIYQLKLKQNQGLILLSFSTVASVTFSFLLSFFIKNLSTLIFQASSEDYFIFGFISLIGCLIVLLPYIIYKNISIEFLIFVSALFWAFIIPVFELYSQANFGEKSFAKFQVYSLILWQVGVGVLLAYGLSRKVKVESGDKLESAEKKLAGNS